MIYIVLLAIVGIAMIYYYKNYWSKTHKDQNTVTYTINTGPAPEEKNPYSSLRNLAFGIGVKNPGALPTRIITEWERNNATITLMCSESGDASLYLSNGTAIIGSGIQGEVKAAALRVVSISAPYFEKAALVSEFSLPQNGSVNFYRVTNAGVYLICEKTESLQTGASPYSDLFALVNDVLTQLRITSEKNKTSS